MEALSLYEPAARTERLLQQSPFQAAPHVLGCRVQVAHGSIACQSEFLFERGRAAALVVRARPLVVDADVEPNGLVHREDRVVELEARRIPTQDGVALGRRPDGGAPVQELLGGGDRLPWLAVTLRLVAAGGQILEVRYFRQLKGL